MKENKFYITTPIYYASGSIHMGHCYTTVLADALARYHRLKGDDVFFLTGSDEHGLKIETNAKNAGLDPQTFVDNIVKEFKEVWASLNISYDKFIRTTDSTHVALVKKIFKDLYDKGDIYKGEYKGLYCVPCETYFSKSDLIDGKCPDCGREVVEVGEECYFLRLSKYQKWLEEFYEKNPDFLVPEARKNEILNNFVKAGVNDLCVSRTTFDWGVSVDFDPKHVVYVWIDALLNYISALGYGTDNDEDFKKYWPADIQLVGRDISRFHAVIWPILLHILGLEIPHRLHSHGFLTMRGDKISKSKGGGFDPITLSNRYSTDAVRYWLLKDGPIYFDVPYSSELFLKTINADLCNNLGNLVSRTTAMMEQYFGSIVPKAKKIVETEDSDFVFKISKTRNDVIEAMEDSRVDLAIRNIFALVDSANKYIDVTMPWALKKDSNIDRLQTVMYNLFEALKVVGNLLQIFLPDTSNKIMEKLGLKYSHLADLKYKPDEYDSHTTKGEALFNRLNIDEELKWLASIDPANKKEEKVTKTMEKMTITIDDFDKLDLRVGRIVASEKIEGSDKLLKNTVDLGSEKRIIVSGIAKYYEPNDLIGKSCVVVTNLKPIKLKGVESFGMILCASDNEGKLTLITPSEDMNPGSEVS